MPHAHVLLHPETASGRLLRTSGNKEGEPGDDRFEFLRGTFNTRARQLYVALSQEPKTPEAAERLSASQFMVLAFHAWNTAGPNSMDALAESVALLKQWTHSRDYPEVLQEAAQAAADAFRSEDAKDIDPDAVEASFGRIQQSLDDARTASFEAALEVVRTVAAGRNSPDSYRPVTSPHAAPGVPLAGDYFALAGRPTGKRITSLEAAFQARRKESNRHRGEFNKALKAYKAAMARVQEVLDQTHLRAANGSLRVITSACAVTNTTPDHLDVGIGFGRPTPRAVLSTERAIARAEHELATLSAIEAAAHEPEDPNATPAILASRHAPKLRPLNNPLPKGPMP